MSNICMICDSINNGEKWNLQISDNKTSIIINGHKSCIDETDNKIKNIKDVKKKTVDKVLAEINFNKLLLNYN